MLLEEKLHEALEELDDDEKIAIYCRYWEQMSILEISRQLNYSWTKTNKLINQVLNQLEDKFQDYQCHSNREVA